MLRLERREIDNGQKRPRGGNKLRQEGYLVLSSKESKNKAQQSEAKNKRKEEKMRMREPWATYKQKSSKFPRFICI